jgi:hypothetical protein
MSHPIRKLFSSRRIRNTVVSVAASAALVAGVLLPVKPVAAFSGAVIINASGYPGTISFYTTEHSIGTCNGYTWPSNTTFTMSGHGSKTCEGDSFGPLKLHLSSIPYGYTFSFSQGYTSSGVSTYSCGTTCQYINFSGARSLTLNAVFTQIPGPSTPSVSVGTRTTTSVGLNWSASVPGGLNRYEVIKNGAVIATTGAQSYTQSGLTCGTNHSYSVRVWDNYGRSATSAAVNTSTLACPTNTATTPTSTPSSTTTTTNSNSTPRTTTATSTNRGTVSTVAATTSTPSNSTASNADAQTLAETTTDSDAINSEPVETEEEVSAPAKRHFPRWAKILLGIGLIALVLAILRIIQVRRANSGANDYWNTPPTY